MYISLVERGPEDGGDEAPKVPRPPDISLVERGVRGDEMARQSRAI